MGRLAAIRRAARARIALAAVFAAVVIALLLWLGGAFGRKIAPGDGPSTVPAPASAPTAVVRRAMVAQYETAVGSIEPALQAAVASRILSRVTAIEADAGRRVGAGEVLVRLDDTDLRERRARAEAALAAEQAVLEQARDEFDRIERSHRAEAASEVELIRARSAVRTAEARTAGAGRAVSEAAVHLEHATVVAPFDGLVIEKSVEVGDTVLPGQVLLVMYDPTRMQIVADVRESLSPHLAVGDEVIGEIDALELVCTATVTEIVPAAAADSRSFRVKVSGPCPPGVRPGMFARLRIPLEEREVVLVPAAAIRHVGQLDLVDVRVDDDGGPARTLLRTVRLGRRHGDDVEVLAGLRPGETVVLGGAAAEPAP